MTCWLETGLIYNLEKVNQCKNKKNRKRSGTIGGKNNDKKKSKIKTKDKKWKKKQRFE